MMEKLWREILGNRRNPLCSPLLFILWVVSLIYRLGLYLNSLMTSTALKLEVPVISVGNLTIGGTGKTPMVIEIASYFIRKGKSVGIASSGYGRRAKDQMAGTGREIAAHGPEMVGDEILMMAERLPEVLFAVAETKTEAARLLVAKHQPELILIDDGFQHRRLARDIDLLLIDATGDIRKESLFPLGRRREPLSAIKRADLVILTRAEAKTAERFEWVKEKYGKETVPVSFAWMAVKSDRESFPLETLAERPVYIFAGVGNFDALRVEAMARFKNIRQFRRFPDHCRYERREQITIRKDIEQFQPEFVITTHKDYVKLRGFDFGIPIYYLEMDIRYPVEQEALYKFLRETLLKKYGKKL